jgi:putative methyltransferase (TIGR04325 family)
MEKYIKKIKLLFNKKNNSIYSGLYNTWSEAEKNSSKKQGYANKKYDNRSLKKFTVNEKYTSGRNMIVPIISATLKTDNFTILDIGGGVNSVFSHLSSSKAPLGLCYVLERDEVASKFNNLVPSQHTNVLKYISDVKSISHNALDIIYFGSSVQYIANYKTLIQSLIEFNPKYIIFSENIFTEIPNDIWVLQQNMGSDTFPNLFISEKKFIYFMKKNGYTCDLNFCTPGDHSHDQIDRKQYECKTLIFGKKYYE